VSCALNVISTFLFIYLFISSPIFVIVYFAVFHFF
jgi:hypothetical protein